MAYIRKVVTASGATAVQVCEKVGDRQRVLAHIGSAHDEVGLALLMDKAHKWLQVPGQGEFDLDALVESDREPRTLSSVSRLLWEILEMAYERIGFSQVRDAAFKQLVFARIVEPTTKADTPRVIEQLGVKSFSVPTFHRCLKRIVERDYQDQVCRISFDFATRGGRLALALFDTTTLHFQTDKTDELRAAGRSKEGRFGPQVQFGLLTDTTGFPLEFILFPGNKGETKYLIPTLQALANRHGTKLKDLIVVADAGILSARNCVALEALGFNFIVGSKTSSAKKEVLDQLQNTDTPKAFTDGQIFERTRTMTGPDLPTTKRRVVYQYKKKRADKDLKVLQDQRAAALKIVGTPSKAKKTRFVSTRGSKPAFNQELYNQAEHLAGLKGYVTNLPKNVASGTQIVAWYTNLFQIERSFRMSKNDLDARPFHHHTENAIHAHLVIVFTALALNKYLEQKTGLSKNKLIQQLGPLKDSIIRIGTTTHTIKTEIPPKTRQLLHDLQKGY